ncbi:hypothetical protein Tco_1405368 [Tanacetum coccineum]
MASEHSSLEPALHEMTPATISSGLVPNPPPSTLFVPPSRTDWDLLFQPLFDELLNPSSSVDRPTPEVIASITEVVAPELATSTSLPSSTTVNQDAPSPKENHDLDVAHMNNDPFFGIPIPEKVFESSSSDVIPIVVHTTAPNSEHALEIDSLKRMVKKLEKKQRSMTHELRRLYKVGLSARVISSEDEGQDMDEKEVSTADPVNTAGEVVTAANVEVSTVSPTTATITTVELTLA